MKLFRKGSFSGACVRTGWVSLHGGESPSVLSKEGSRGVGGWFSARWVFVLAVGSFTFSLVKVDTI